MLVRKSENEAGKLACLRTRSWYAGRSERMFFRLRSGPHFRYTLLALALFLALPGITQRIYKASSVLASGTWYKIAIGQAGIYRIDIPFLSSLGVNTSNLASSSIRLFGNG